VSKQRIFWLETGYLKSKWHEDLIVDWKPDEAYIAYLKEIILKGDYLPPVVVAREGNEYFIINGHHRVYAHRVLGKDKIKCLQIEGTFEESEPLRKAERLLKDYDCCTDYRYGFSGFLDRWSAAAEGREGGTRYRPTLGFQIYRLLRKMKNKLLRKSPE
jgi:hypothetical protein